MHRLKTIRLSAILFFTIFSLKSFAPVTAAPFQRATVNRERSAAALANTGNKAISPIPADGYIVVEGGKHVLSWKPSPSAVSQNLYVGESAAAVLAQKKPTLAHLESTITSVTLPLRNPVLGKNYYWRIESLDAEGAPLAPGNVWSFRTVSKQLKVYLLSGQSNAVGCTPEDGLAANYRGLNPHAIIFVRGECRVGKYGWAYLCDGLGGTYEDKGNGTIGAELGFGYAMAPSDPAHVIAILKCAWGASTLGVDWRPPSSGGRTGKFYTGYVKAIHEGLADLDPAFQPDIVAMLWMQGEYDAQKGPLANEYETNLKNFIHDIRAEVKKPELPFILGTISKAPAWQAFGDTVRAAEAKVAATVPHAATFPTADFGLNDPYHYDLAGELELGRRFAKATKELTK